MNKWWEEFEQFRVLIEAGVQYELLDELCEWLYENGKEDGKEDGYDVGYDDGYQEGSDDQRNWSEENNG